MYDRRPGAGDRNGPTFINVGPSLLWLLGSDGPTYCGPKSPKCRTFSKWKVQRRGTRTECVAPTVLHFSWHCRSYIVMVHRNVGPSYMWDRRPNGHTASPVLHFLWNVGPSASLGRYRRAYIFLQAPRSYLFTAWTVLHFQKRRTVDVVAVPVPHFFHGLDGPTFFTAPTVLHFPLK